MRTVGEVHPTDTMRTAAGRTVWSGLGPGEI
jgi:hypothetical protein